MEFRKMVMMTIYARQQNRRRYKEQIFGLHGRRRGWDIGESSTVIYTLSWVREIAAKKLLYNAGSPAWCSLMTWRGGVGGRGWRLKTEVVYIRAKSL